MNTYPLTLFARIGKTLHADASDLGHRAGDWPATFVIDGGDDLPPITFSLSDRTIDREGDLTAVIYENRVVDLSVTLWND